MEMSGNNQESYTKGRLPEEHYEISERNSSVSEVKEDEDVCEDHAPPGIPDLKF